MVDTPYISLDTQEVTDNPISLDTGTGNYLLDPSTVRSRAFKASYGLSKTPAARTQDNIEQNISAGQEDSVRTDASTQLNIDRQSKKIQQVAQIAASKPDALTPDDLKWINGTTPFNTFYDPKTVFETTYANNYTSELDQFANRTGSPEWNLFSGMTDADAMKTYGSTVMAWHEYLLNKAQNLQSQIKNQSAIDYGLDFLKMAFPVMNPYYELKERGNVPGVGFFSGGLLSGNLENQRRGLLNMPFKERVDTFDKIITGMAKDNPQAALAFTAAMMGQSSTDKFLNGLNTIGTIADAAAAVRTVSAFARPLYTGFSIARQARRAIRTVAEANAISPETSRASILASVGDIPSASALQVNQITKDLASGTADITKTGLERLPSFMRIDKAHIEADPGNLTPTQVNAILEQYNTTENKILNSLANSVRPYTVPLSEANPEVIDAIQKSTFGRYPGMSNAIIDMSDPVLEPLSRRYFITARIGRRAGEFFTSEDEALQYARMHGVSVSYTPEQISNLELRISNIKEELKAGIDIDADTAGLNRYYGLEDRLKDLTAQLEDALKAPKGHPTVEGSPKTSTIEVVPPRQSNTSIEINGKRQPELEQKIDSSIQTASVDQQGLGFYIKVTKPVDETSKVVRDFIVNPKRQSSVSPDSWTQFIPYANHARTAEDTFSAEARANRKAAVYPQDIMLDIAREEGKDLPKLRDYERKALNEVLHFSQDAPDPVTGEPGYYFDSPKQLQDHYLRVYDRMPTEAEQKAYFAVKRWGEYDHILRSLALYRNKTRLGVETHQVLAKDTEGNLIKSKSFDGRVENKFPGGSGTNILMVGDAFHQSEMRAVESFSQAEEKAITEQIKNGQIRLVHLYDPETTPFNGLVEDGDKLTHYVLAKQIDTSPLTWDQLPFRGGGHHVYEAPHYLKLPIIKTEKIRGGTRQTYLGDRTVAAIEFKKDGEDLAKKFNQVGNYIVNNRLEEAKAFYEQHLAAYGEWKDFIKKWYPVKDENGIVHDPVFNPELFKNSVIAKGGPFRVVPKNKAIVDMDDTFDQAFGTNFRDGTKQGSMARNFQVAYTGQRDAENLRTAVNEGTQANPVYNFRTAEKADPIKTASRALSSIIHSTFMDDYKTYGVETWLKEASPYVKPELKARFNSSPFWSFKTADRNMFKNGTPQNIINKLMANHFKINQLVGTPTLLDTFLHEGAQALADASYSKGGELGRKFAIVPQWLLPKLTDPFAFMRSLTFNAYLGFGAPWQLLVQMMTYVNIHAISPLHAPAGTLGALLHEYSRINQNIEILNHLDKIASTVRVPSFKYFKPGEWLEATRALDESGFAHVGAEQALVDNLNRTGVMKTKWGNFLRLGQTPFREGEKATRLGAWYTAFKEFREAHPTGAITNEDRIKILNRADDLYGNMSSASKSALNAGILSLPTQFFNYSIRSAELFWSGTRLGATASDRTLARSRLLMYNWGMFGLPGGIGIAGAPLQDYLRQKALDEGYKVGDNWITSLVMEGIPATVLAMITGNWYNVGPRYGNQGFQQVWDGLVTDPSFLKLVGGASGTLAMNTWSNSQGLANAMTALFRGDPKLFPFRLDDILDLINGIQTVSKGRALVAAINTRKWINKNGQYIQDVSPLNALFMTLTGLQPSLQSDMHNIEVNLQDQKELTKQSEKGYQKEMSLGLIALSNNDGTNADSHFKRAVGYLVIGDLPEDAVSRAMASANKLNVSLLDRIAWSRYITNAPASKREEYTKMYSFIHKYLEKQEQNGTKQ